MTTTPTSIKPKLLVFQEDRGPGFQDSLYHNMGFQFILAPNRYRKLAGKTPREMPKSDIVEIMIGEMIEQELSCNCNLDFDQFTEIVKTRIKHREIPEVPVAVFGAGIRLLFLNLRDRYAMQQTAIQMMAEDWPEYAHLNQGYEPHINLVDEILIWRSR